MTLEKRGVALPTILLCVVLAFLQFSNKACEGAKTKHGKRVMRSYNGTYSTHPSLALVMESSPYYNWNYIFTTLILSDTCAVSRARGIVDSSTYPPTLITGLPRTIFIPGSTCDIQYHIRNIILNDPPFNFPTRQHDISLLQVRQKIHLGYEGCRGTPVLPTWVSCDEHGPPVDYKDCYFTSYGLTYSLADGVSTPLAPENISPTKSRIKVLSKEKCEERRLIHEPNATVVLHSKDEMCVSTIDNHSPSCDQDWNGAVFCKYWKSDKHSASGSGSGHYSDRSHSYGNDFDRYVTVGHRVYGFGQLFCQAESAALILKFGSQTYRSLFRTCGFVCSNTLPKGYRCQGNPPSYLGPVYCIPKKITPHSDARQYKNRY